MKRVFIAMVITMTMLTCGNPVTLAYPNPTVYLDGRQLSFDVPAQIISGRTMVPMRAIFQELGANIQWDETNQTVRSTKGSLTFYMGIGSNVYTVNGRPCISDVSARIVNGRTLVPLRAVSEGLGCAVNYNAASNTVTITSGTDPEWVVQKYSTEVDTTDVQQVPKESINQTVTAEDTVPTVGMYSDPKEARTGYSKLGEFSISELKSGALRPTTAKLTLPSGCMWASTPQVYVAEGDLKLSGVSVNGSTLSILVNGSSTVNSKIVISNASIYVDSSVPEGCISVKLTGCGGDCHCAVALRCT